MPTENMKVSIENFRVDRLVNPETGHITLFFKDESWGPVVTGATEEEAREKFKRAAKGCMIIKSIQNIQLMYEDDSMGLSKVTELVHKNKDDYFAIEKSLQC